MQYNKLIGNTHEHYRAVVLERTKLPPCSECQVLRLENAKLRMALSNTGYRDPTRPIIPAGYLDPKLSVMKGVVQSPFRTPRDLTPMTNARVTDWEPIWAGSSDVLTSRTHASKFTLRPGQVVASSTESLYKEIGRLIKELDHRNAEIQLCRHRLGEAPPSTAASAVDLFGPTKNRQINEHVTADKDKVGQQYSSLFEKEWETALQVLETSGMEYRKCTDLLLNVLTEVYKFSEKMSEEQLKKIVDGTNAVLTQSTERTSKSSVQAVGGVEARIYQRKVADNTAAAIRQLYTVKNIEELKNENVPDTVKNSSPIRKYVSKCVDVTWCMCVHDPAMVFDLTRQKGYTFDLSFYQYYKTEGSVIDIVVWPVLLTQRQGAVVSKGWADAVPSKQKGGGASTAEGGKPNTEGGATTTKASRQNTRK